MKVSELKEVLANCPDDMEVIMPVSNDYQVDSINHVYAISSAAIIRQFGDQALLLNTCSENFSIRDQLDALNPLSLECEKVLLPHVE